MAEAVKFTFDEMFDARTGTESSQVLAQIKKTRWTEEEIEVLKADAHAAGKAETMSAIETQTAQQNATAWEQIASAATNALTDISEAENNIRADAAKLSFSISRKLSDALITLHPKGEIDAVIQECLTHLSHQPRLVIRVTDSLALQVEDSIQQAAEERGMADKIMVVGDTKLKLGDCRIEWSDGGVSRNWDDLIRQTTEIIDRYIETLSGDHNKPAKEENSHV